MIRFFHLAGILSLLVFGMGCNIINPVEKTPTYIHIDSFQFVADPTMGTASQKITNVRVNFDNQTIGIFDLPANVPILMDKPGMLSLTPGVTYSGLNDIQVSYPFFRTDTMTLNPTQGQSITVAPKTMYYDASSFSNNLQETFDGSNSFVNMSGDTNIVIETVDVFEGTGSGKLFLDDGDVVEIIMNESFDAPQEAFIELNYKCNIPFYVGLQSENGGEFYGQYLYGYKPINTWNKVYIALNEFIGSYPNRAYRLIIKATPENSNGGYVLLDNIKILSRN